MNKDIETLKLKYNIHLVDFYELNGYYLYLLKDKNFNKYEIAISYMSNPFTTIEGQSFVNKKINIKKIFNTKRSFIKKIKDWLKLHKEIYIGSFDKEKTKKYHCIIKKYIKCSDIVFESYPEKHSYFKINKEES